MLSRLALSVAFALLLAGATSHAPTATATASAPDALMLAVQRGDVDAARKLLDRGANPNVSDRDGWTPLALAAGADNDAAVATHLALTKLLLDRGAKPTQRVFALAAGCCRQLFPVPSSSSAAAAAAAAPAAPAASAAPGSTSAASATPAGATVSASVVNVGSGAGAGTGAGTGAGVGAVCTRTGPRVRVWHAPSSAHCPAPTGGASDDALPDGDPEREPEMHLEVGAQLLRELFARGHTLPPASNALEIAVDEHALESARLLLEHGADPIAASGSWERPLVELVLEGGSEELVPLFVAQPRVHEWIRTIRPREGSGLHIATKTGKRAVVESVVAMKPPLDGQDGDGQTAVIIAARNGDADIVDILLAKGASAHFVDHTQQSARRAALAQGHTQIAKRLERAGSRECTREPLPPMTVDGVAVGVEEHTSEVQSLMNNLRAPTRIFLGQVLDQKKRAELDRARRAWSLWSLDEGCRARQLRTPADLARVTSLRTEDDAKAFARVVAHSNYRDALGPLPYFVDPTAPVDVVARNGSGFELRRVACVDEPADKRKPGAYRVVETVSKGGDWSFAFVGERIGECR